MNSASRELFRQCLLMQLEQAKPYAVPVSVLRVGALAGGFKVEASEIEAELGYLRDKGLVRESTKIISPEVKRWEITADGRDQLAKEGLA